MHSLVTKVYNYIKFVLIGYCVIVIKFNYNLLRLLNFI